MYEQMCLIRHFETFLEDLFKKGLLFGTIHCCMGQEAVAVGIVNAISKDDIIIGNHRSHGHFLAYTDDVEGLMAEIMGKECGVVGGRGGSQHLSKGNFYSNGIQGSMVPVATGMAFAEKLKNTRNIAVCFMGDGTLGQGVVYESMNMAALYEAPILYVVENNFYAMSTSVKEGVAGSMVDRGRAFSIKSTETTSNDVEAIFNRAKEIVDEVRDSGKPHFWVVNTYRLCGHSKSDDRSYRSREEESEWMKKDPLLIAEVRLPSNVCGTIKERCKNRVEETFDKLQHASFPSVDNVCGSKTKEIERENIIIGK